MSTSSPIRSIEHLVACLEAATDEGARTTLRLFGTRLVAEMTADVPTVLSTVAPDFTYRTLPDGGAPPVTSAEALGAALGGMGAAGVRMIWFDWGHVIADASGVGFDGIMHSALQLGDGDDLTVMSTQLGGFIGVRDGLMVEEVVYSAAEGSPAPHQMPASDLPSIDEVRAWGATFASA